MFLRRIALYSVLSLLIASPAFATDEAWWGKMNDNAATTVVVDSVNANNGTYVGHNTNEATTTGKINAALSSFGTDDYMTVPDSDPISPTAGITINTWIDTYSVVDNDGIAAKTNNYNFNQGLTGITGCQSGKLCFAIRDGAAWRATSADVGLDTGAGFQMVTATYDGSTLKIFVNGTQSGAGTSWSGNIDDESGASLEIGRGGAAGRELESAIDDFRIFGRALNQTEIDELYNSGNGTETGLGEGGGGGGVSPAQFLAKGGSNADFVARPGGNSNFKITYYP